MIEKMAPREWYGHVEGAATIGGVRERDRPQRAWVNDVKRLLREGYAGRISLEELGIRIGIHPASLSRGFRVDEGITVGEYLSRVRVQQACRQMSDANVTLAEVAVSCGFADQSHLTRVFKSLIGLPPGAFRERMVSSRIRVKVVQDLALDFG
jgi:AraC family transcriptional regulator